MGTISKEERKRIEDMFIKRMRLQYINKGTKKYLNAQAEFFSGAMTALNIADAPWSVAIMSGRVIEDERERKQTPDESKTTS